MDFNKTKLLMEAAKENSWYSVRLWMKNGEKEDHDFQAENDKEAIKKFKSPKFSKGTEGELRRVKNGKSGETVHVANHTW